MVGLERRAKTFLSWWWAAGVVVPLWACGSSNGGSGDMSAAGSSGMSASGGSSGAGGSAAGAGGANTIAACTACAAQKCADTLSTCTADSGCNMLIERYYGCLSDPQRTTSVLDCGFLFTEEGGGAKANAVEDCMTGAAAGGDGVGCVEACGRPGGTGGASSSCVRATASDSACASFENTTPIAWTCPDMTTAQQFASAQGNCFTVTFIPAGLCCPS